MTRNRRLDSFGWFGYLALYIVLPIYLHRLRDGRSIRTVSALLLQLVQTSAHDVRLEARKIEKVRQNKFALRRQESFSESQPGPPEPFLDETDQEVGVYTSFLLLISE